MTSAQMSMCASLVRFIREHERSDEDAETPPRDDGQASREEHDEPVAD